ncbi:MAG TPA: ABC transporter permease [Gammaproteobacteria bacterium]|nr:ABC transporter permease [Gammaproteobacteria bacterium]
MIGHYVTIAMRNLRRAPLTALVNVLALALGLAAFVTAYGIVTFWNKSERHFANADRTYVITADLEAVNGAIKTGVQPTTNRLYADYLKAEFTEDFEAVARTQTMSNEGGVSAGDVSDHMFIVGADAEFLDIFDLPFVKGDPKNALRNPNSAVLTQDAAKRLFGTDDVLGRTITLGSVLDVTVTGVIGEIPEPSYFGHSPAANVRFDVLSSWDTLDGIQFASRVRQAARQGQPAPQAPQQQPPRPEQENWLGGYCCMTFVMIKPSSPLTAETLDAQLREWGNRHVPVPRREVATLTVGAVPVGSLMVSQLNGQLLGGTGLSITTVLLALAALVLVVACVNYASLATAQAARRAREVGLRKAIGANRGRVMTQYLAEAAILTAIAAIVALIAVRLATPVIRNAVGINLSVGLYNGGFWLFLAALLVAVTLLGGAYPSFVLARVPPIEALRIGRTKVGPRFATTVLVGAQFAAASFLLIVVYVMFAQNRELQRTGLGVDSDPVLVVTNAQQYSGIDNKLLQDELRRIPQVKSVSETSQSPWSPGVGLAPVSRSPDETVVRVTAIMNTVGYDYFKTLGYTMLGGREFDPARGEDVRPQGPPTGKPINVVIDASLAEELGFSPPESAVEQDVYFPSNAQRAFNSVVQPLHVIGVVANKPLRFNGAGAKSNMFFMTPGLQFQLVKISSSDVSGGLAAVDALWKRLSPKTSATRKFLDQLYDENYRNFARVNQVSAALALVAVAISVVGLFSMAVQVASRRLHEIGVRKSVGAHARQIVVMLLLQFSKPVLAANVIAWLFAYLAAQKYLSVFATRIALTPVPFAASLAATVAVASLVVAGQALRASRVSPARVLRAEKNAEVSDTGGV